MIRSLVRRPFSRFLGIAMKSSSSPNSSNFQLGWGWVLVDSQNGPGFNECDERPKWTVVVTFFTSLRWEDWCAWKRHQRWPAKRWWWHVPMNLSKGDWITEDLKTVAYIYTYIYIYVWNYLAPKNRSLLNFVNLGLWFQDLREIRNSMVSSAKLQISGSTDYIDY